MRVAPLLILYYSSTALAFVAHQQIARSFLLSPLAAKSICTFDGDDFSGDVGDWPYSAADLGRLDSTVDTNFYAEPRFVTHIVSSFSSFMFDSAVSCLRQTKWFLLFSKGRRGNRGPDRILFRRVQANRQRISRCARSMLVLDISLARWR